MKLHGNAELSLNKRRRLVRRVGAGWTLTEAAEAAEVSVRTARKWVRRYPAEGKPGLLDRSSRPHSCPTATSERHVQLIVMLRRSTRMTGAEIAEVLALPITTVQGILTRIGLGKRSRLNQERAVRYEYRVIAAIAYRGRELVRVMAEEVPASELRYVVPFEARSRYVGGDFVEQLAKARGGTFRRNPPDVKGPPSTPAG